MIKIPRRREICDKFKASGGRIAAVLPIHYPRALLRSFDFLPVEVWGPPHVDVSYGGAHLQPYVCSVVHNALSFIKTGGLDVTDLIIVPHACDSLQGLGSILIDFVRPKQPVLPFYLPRGRRREDLDFLKDEIRSLYVKLSNITGKRPDRDTMMMRIEIEELADLKLHQIYESRIRNESVRSMSNYEFYKIIRSREFLPAEDFIKIADEISNASEAGDDGIPVILSGIVPEPMEILNAIEEAGGKVIADDLACCGRRLYSPGVSDDPIERMAETIMNAPPDVTRGSLIEERFEHLKNLSEKTGARGIIFYTVKFCEPELFDLPELRDLLKKSGIPSVHVEIDIGDPLPHQTITRLTAFLEVLE